QIVSSIVSLPLHRISDPEAHAALSQTRDRIDVISATHRSLYELGTHDRVDCNRLLPDLCAQMVDTYAIDRELTLDTDVSGEIVLPISKAVSLCLAVTELVTNACKYAFEGRASGGLTLGLDGDGERICVTVADNGVGIREGARHESGTGIGTLLVKSLTGILQADVSCDTGPDGTRHTIAFDRVAF
ncbi:MAG: sensor histidine kinase, partial [Henriciella sp.]